MARPERTGTTAPVADAAAPPAPAAGLTRRGRESRERILAAAADLFHRQGVHATSVDQVLAASEAGKSQFYHYFGSKDALVQEVLAWHGRRIAAQQGEVLVHLDTLDGIAAWFAAIVEAAAERGCVGGCPVGTLASELAGQDRQVDRQLEDTFALWRGRLVEGLTALRDRGELPPEPSPEALADHVMAAKQGGMLLAKTRGEVAPLRHALDGALAYLRGLAVG